MRAVFRSTEQSLHAFRSAHHTLSILFFINNFVILLKQPSIRSYILQMFVRRQMLLRITHAKYLTNAILQLFYFSVSSFPFPTSFCNYIKVINYFGKLGFATQIFIAQRERLRYIFSHLDIFFHHGYTSDKPERRFTRERNGQGGVNYEVTQRIILYL